MQLELFEEMRDFRNHKKYLSGIFKTKVEIERELRDQEKQRIFRVLSFGGGTQSAHLLEQHLRGQIKYDLIVFADTGAEPNFIHEQVNWWRKRQQEMGNKTPFLVTTHGSMQRGLEEMLMRYIFTDYQRFQMPVYCAMEDRRTGSIIPAGIMPRQCTVDFKIIPVKQAARRFVMEQLGLRYRQQMPGDVGFIIDIGFSFDEIKRIKTYRSTQFKYMYLSYPLVEENLSTEDSIRFLAENGFPNRRSRCYLCPFNCDVKTIGMDWREIIENEPFSFLKACWLDEHLRKVQATGTKIMRSIPFFHYSRRPLCEVYAEEYQRIYNKHAVELNAWVSEWRAYIQRKYQKNQLRIS